MHPILELTSVYKSFSGISVLQDINFALYPGEISFLVGENGAGKSTLVQILCGMIPMDKGSISINGTPIQINSPKDAINNGIIALQQEPFLFDSMTVAENIFAKHWNGCSDQLGLIKRGKMNSMAQGMIDELGFQLKSTQRIEKLNLAQKRMVEIIRLSLFEPKILILDEPLSSVGFAETAILQNLLKKFKQKSTTVLFVSQSISEIGNYADRITILRDGKLIKSLQEEVESEEQIDKLIWGKYYPEKYPKLETAKGSEIFCVENLSAGSLLKNISFSISQGEILGITGLVGSGRSQLAKTIFGLIPAVSGSFYIDRLKANIRSPRDAIALGLAYVTEDRYNEGLFMNLNILQNAFVIENAMNRRIIPNRNHDIKVYKKYEKLLNLKVHSPEKKIFTISGGVQQKILLMRWFMSDARIFIFDEPTRGIDIPSKVDIYNLMNDLARKKGAIIMISSNVEELVGMCDRILVMTNGTISYEANRKNPGEFDNMSQHIV